jgi:hypothetical protein
VQLRRSWTPIRGLALASLGLFASLGLVGLSSPAHAAGEKDKEAEALLKKAMDEDFLNVELAKAEKKLKDALKKCGKDGCTPGMLARVHVALAAVASANGKNDVAKEELVAALKQDPKITLPADLKSPDLEKALKDAQKEAGVGADPPKKPDPGEDPDEDPPKKPKKPKKPDEEQSDLEVVQVPEQELNTPIPIFVVVDEGVGATKVTLKYKPFGSTKWKSLDMKKMGKGWGVEIPCDDVTVTGDVRWYVVAEDGDGEEVSAGSKKESFKTTVKNQIEGDEPSFPGKKAPKQCAKKEDCPPGLPGCPDAKGGPPRGDKGWGASCEQTQECKSGFICLNGSCEEGKDDGSGDGKKAYTERNKYKHWRTTIGLWGQLDLLFVGGSDNACSSDLASQFPCFYTPSGGATRRYATDPIPANGTNAVSGGLGPSGRILLSIDQQFHIPLTLGLRGGLAFGGAPESPLGGEIHPHIEGRVAFHPLGLTEKKKLKPYVFAGVGGGRADFGLPVTVCDSVDNNGNAATSDGCGVGQNSTYREMTSYFITGTAFVNVGAGVTYGITDIFGLAGELKLNFFVPTFGFAISPTLGPVVSF